MSSLTDSERIRPELSVGSEDVHPLLTAAELPLENSETLHGWLYGYSSAEQLILPQDVLPQLQTFVQDRITAGVVSEEQAHYLTFALGIDSDFEEDQPQGYFEAKTIQEDGFGSYTDEEFTDLVTSALRSVAGLPETTSEPAPKEVKLARVLLAEILSIEPERAEAEFDEASAEQAMRTIIDHLHLVQKAGTKKGMHGLFNSKLDAVVAQVKPEEHPIPDFFFVECLRNGFRKLRLHSSIKTREIRTDLTGQRSKATSIKSVERTQAATTEAKTAPKQPARKKNGVKRTVASKTRSKKTAKQKKVRIKTDLTPPPISPDDISRPAPFNNKNLQVILGRQPYVGRGVGARPKITAEEFPLFSRPRKLAEVDLDIGDSLKPVIEQMAQFPLLTHRGEAHYFGRYQAGIVMQEYERAMKEKDPSFVLNTNSTAVLEAGREAYQIIYQANIRLVFSIAKKYSHQMPLEDLVMEGCMGLQRAVTQFDPAKGYKFSTYATWWIRQSISRSVADQARTIRIPVHYGERLSKLRRAQIALEEELQRDPTAEEIARKMNTSVEVAQELVGYQQRMRVASLNKAIGDSETELGDLIADDRTETEEEALDNVRLVEMKGEIEVLFGALNPRERHIISSRYGLYGTVPTLDELGRSLGLTRERVRQIQIKAMEKMRNYAHHANLKEKAN